MSRNYTRPACSANKLQCYVPGLSIQAALVRKVTHKGLLDLLEDSSLFAPRACRSTLGNRSLSSELYTPDFTAVALNSAPFRVLRISRSAYRAALEATQLSPVVGYQVHMCANITEWVPSSAAYGLAVWLKEECLLQRARATAQAWKSVAPFDGVQAPPGTSDSSRGHSAWPVTANAIPAARTGQTQRLAPGKPIQRCTFCIHQITASRSGGLHT